jgi:hypothetical protein
MQTVIEAKARAPLFLAASILLRRILKTQRRRDAEDRKGIADGEKHSPFGDAFSLRPSASVKRGHGFERVERVERHRDQRPASVVRFNPSPTAR